MRQRSQLTPDMTMDAIMRRWPHSVAVLLKYGLLCVGCPIGRFHTITDACREHEIDEPEFVAELEVAIRAMA